MRLSQYNACGLFSLFPPFLMTRACLLRLTAVLNITSVFNLFASVLSQALKGAAWPENHL